MIVIFAMLSVYNLPWSKTFKNLNFNPVPLSDGISRVWLNLLVSTISPCFLNCDWTWTGFFVFDDCYMCSSARFLFFAFLSAPESVVNIVIHLLCSAFNLQSWSFLSEPSTLYIPLFSSSFSRTNCQIRHSLQYTSTLFIAS